jgi:hypothetical protein
MATKTEREATMEQTSVTVNLLEVELALAVARGRATARAHRAATKLAEAQDAAALTAPEWDAVLADLMAAAAFAERAQRLAAMLATFQARAAEAVVLAASRAATTAAPDLSPRARAAIRGRRRRVRARAAKP